MTSKKKKLQRPPHRIRLSSFERALRDAEERLEKAITERTDCNQKLAALNNEIPYLEGILRALTPADDTLDSNLDRSINQLRAAAADRAKVTPPPAPAPDLLGTENLDPVDQAQFLARFMPRPGRTTTPLHSAPAPAPSPGNSDDPDEFLQDDTLGDGRQLIE